MTVMSIENEWKCYKSMITCSLRINFMKNFAVCFCELQAMRRTHNQEDSRIYFNAGFIMHESLKTPKKEKGFK